MRVTVPLRSYVLWFAIGTATALFLLATQAMAVGGYSGLLQVGEQSAVRAMIESELPEVELSPRSGHDGQISFAMGLDLLGREVPTLLDDGGYRYRRILYPAIASLFGLLDGPALLVGMITVSALGMGLATAAVAILSDGIGAARWTVLGVLANPGVWLAVRLLTPDALGLGLAVMGFALFQIGRHPVAIVLLAAAALAKDQFLLVAISLAAYLVVTRRPVLALRYALIPTAALASWSLFVTARISNGFTARSNLAAPLSGILDASKTWSTSTAADISLSVLALLVIVATSVALIGARSRTLRYVTLPWIALAITSSAWVWDLGNNSMRAFAIIALLGILAAGRWRDNRNMVRATSPEEAH